MATVGAYLNFTRNTEEAFNFYKSVFGGDYYGSLKDKYGVQWMFNCSEKK